MSINEEADVVVVGGGPGGSTLATLVAMRGHRVILLEKDKFPRYQIGESLLPSTVHGVCRLTGVADELAIGIGPGITGMHVLAGDLGEKLDAFEGMCRLNSSRRPAGRILSRPFPQRPRNRHRRRPSPPRRRNGQSPV